MEDHDKDFSLAVTWVGAAIICALGVGVWFAGEQLVDAASRGELQPYTKTVPGDESGRPCDKRARWTVDKNGYAVPPSPCSR